MNIGVNTIQKIDTRMKAYELDNVSMIKELISMDLGITIIVKSACREESVSGRLAIIVLSFSWIIG